MPPLENYSRQLDYTYALGFFPAMEALKKRTACVRRMLLGTRAEGGAVDEITALCDQNHIRIEYADKLLRRISGKDNCFAAAVTEKAEEPLEEGRHIVLHHISDEGNLGTILRTALGFGYGDIAVIRPAADPWHPHVVRGSMGALYSLRVREYESFEDYAEEFPSQSLYPFMLTGSVALQEIREVCPRDHSLIFGNEGSGLPDPFAHMGTPVRIVHSCGIDSLNLSVAAAIAMYEFNKKVSIE